MKSNPAPPAAEPPRPRRGPCPELRAMQRIDDALAELSPAEVARALGWLNARHAAPLTPPSVPDACNPWPSEVT